MTTARPQATAKVFVIMPFALGFDDVYEVIRRAVAEVDEGLAVVRLDDVRAAGSISDDLIHELNSSALCIADVSGANPNVMWEVGYASALRKPLIVLNQSASKLPFDIADLRAVMYEREALSKTLHAPLVEAIGQTLKRYSVAASAVASRPNHRRAAVAVTGSMESPPAKARVRLERALRPYLGREVEWYCGSFGTIDEVVVDLLLGANEARINVVGYSSYDISGNLLEMLSHHPQLEFVDASAEQLPQSPGAPSLRDILFAARADSVIVAWNGVSQGTRELINWLAAQSKDHAVCFVPPTHREWTEPLLR